MGPTLAPVEALAGEDPAAGAQCSRIDIEPRQERFPGGSDAEIAAVGLDRPALDQAVGEGPTPRPPARWS